MGLAKQSGNSPWDFVETENNCQFSLFLDFVSVIFSFCFYGNRVSLLREGKALLRVGAGVGRGVGRGAGRGTGWGSGPCSLLFAPFLHSEVHEEQTCIFC